MDTLRYELMKPSEFDALVECVQDTFPAPRGEVMARVLGIGVDEYLDYTRLVCAKAVEDRLTIAAYDADNRMLGFLICEDFESAPVYSKKKIHEKFLPLIALLEALDNRYRDRHSYLPGEAFHLYMLGVRRETHCKGIGAELTKHALLLAETRGFRVAVAEATGPHSQRMVRRLGFEVREQIRYQDFEFAGKRVFAEITSAESCVLVDKSLNQA